MASLDLSEISICHWIEDVEAHKCGYCKNENCSISNGMWAERLICEDYQNLIDRGWRRSGKYLYKPIMAQTCCPQYTIRCDATSLKLSKSQKKVIKKFNKYLQDGILKTENQHNPSDDGDRGDLNYIPEKPKSDFDLTKVPKELILNEDETRSSQALDPTVRTSKSENPTTAPTIPTDITSDSTENLKRKQVGEPNSSYKQGMGADPNKPLCKKAKTLRLERKQKKLEAMGMQMIPVDSNPEKTLEDFLNNVPQEVKHKLKITLVPTSRPNARWEALKDLEFELYKKYQIVVHNKPDSAKPERFHRFLVSSPLEIKLVPTSRPDNRWIAVQEKEFEVYKKYQTIVHNDEPSKVTLHSFHNFLVSSPLKISLQRVNSENIHYQKTYRLYVKYQTTVHNECPSECDESSFRTFLVDTPLEPQPFNPGSDDGLGYGSFHQQYWIDDKLVAVGVIDILPKCVSSVYFFYDPDYRALTLGTYGSLRELEFVRKLHDKISSLKYYYMGFYIHSCPKMRYKGKLNPSDLICPETYFWVSLDKCIPKLDASKYSKLADDAAQDENACSTADLRSLKVLRNYRFIKAQQFSSRSRELEQMRSMCKLLGKKCAGTILMVYDP